MFSLPNGTSLEFLTPIKQHKFTAETFEGTDKFTVAMMDHGSGQELELTCEFSIAHGHEDYEKVFAKVVKLIEEDDMDDTIEVYHMDSLYIEVSMDDVKDVLTKLN